ncbi:MAG: DUF488 family protein [Thalassobaculum sp.]|uniref:DUF488 domain-containing protein n=1 Tax=Thalassobaculum sp. TaxID=2022740 RepID=UPI0032EC026E
MTEPIRTRRVYERCRPEDGSRVLVDRIWPRGISKGNLRLQHWAKEVAPSDELRRWFGHDPERWVEFRRRYAGELDARPEPVAALREWLAYGPLTLLYAARDDRHNNAVALKEYLEARAPGRE